MRYRSGSLEVREAGFDTARFVDVEELSDLRLSPDLNELLDDVRSLLHRA